MTTMSGSPPAGLTEHRDELESALKALVADRPLPLYRMMGYHMGWAETTGEERISAPPLRAHGALVLLACQALGGNYADALPHACAVEYLYNHMLIHDDIRDGNSERDGRASVCGHGDRRRPSIRETGCTPLRALRFSRPAITGSRPNR
jgi:geranylgeranyl pyrophosphate synthase